MPEETLVIDAKGFVKSFGKKRVVNGVDLQVKRGEIYGFLGPNGSGKTTMIRMICGLMSPDEGSGTCLGYDIIKDSEKIKRQVGYMTQYFSLYKDLTIEENLNFLARVYGLNHRRDRVKKIMKRLAFGSRYKQLCGNLSGGWKQRVALAAALIHEPQLLLLDEPTAGVDPKARREFWDHIFELSGEGITTLVTTHYMDEAERCHRLAYIAYGDLLAHGSIQDIIAQVGLITWTAKGEGLNKLSTLLKADDGVEQVAAFGETLHICGKNAEKLEKAIEPYRKQYDWQKINSSLEDVFISLVNQKQDNFSE